MLNLNSQVELLLEDIVDNSQHLDNDKCPLQELFEGNEKAVDIHVKMQDNSHMSSSLCNSRSHS